MSPSWWSEQYLGYFMSIPKPSSTAKTAMSVWLVIARADRPVGLEDRAALVDFLIAFSDDVGACHAHHSAEHGVGGEAAKFSCTPGD